MYSQRLRWIAIAKWFFVVVVCVLFAPSESLQAQSPRGRRGGGGTRTQRPPGSRQGQGAVEMLPGSHYGRVLSFKPAEGKAGTDSEEESEVEILGMLKVKPVQKGLRTITMQVRKTGDFRIIIGGHTFDVEMFQEVVWSGLYCSAEWEFDPADKKKKPTKKLLKGITVDLAEVAGKIEAIEDDHIVLKVRPANDQQWRHLPPPEPSNRSRSSNNQKPKRVRQLKVKLKIMDEATKFTDAADHELDLSEFEVGQDVTAAIAYGRPAGILVQLRSLTIDEDAAEAEQGKDVGKGKRPGGRGTRGDGPQPRGPRPRGPSTRGGR